MIDVSGDGVDNRADPDSPRGEREALPDTGATVDGLPIPAPGYGGVSRPLRRKVVIESGVLAPGTRGATAPP